MLLDHFNQNKIQDS